MPGLDQGKKSHSSVKRRLPMNTVTSRDKNAASAVDDTTPDLERALRELRVVDQRPEPELGSSLPLQPPAKLMR